MTLYAKFVKFTLEKKDTMRNTWLSFSRIHEKQTAVGLGIKWGIRYKLLALAVDIEYK